MKHRRSEIDSLVKLLIYSFKQGKNLPFTVPKKTCPDLHPSKKIRTKRCKKRHSEIVIKSYDKNENSFHLLYYGMHDPKVVFQSDVAEDIVYDTIKKSMNAKKWGTKNMLEVRMVKKLLKKDDIVRKMQINFRCSVKEKKILVAEAGKRGLEISDYIRLKLFS